MMAKIILAHNKQVVKEYSFSKDNITVGRRKDNIIVIDNPEISNYHAKIDKIGSEYILTDLQSSNGTFANGKKIVSHKLVHGDNVRIGEHFLLFIGTAVADADQMEEMLDKTTIITSPDTLELMLKQKKQKESSASRRIKSPRRLGRLFPALFAVFILVFSGWFMLSYRLLLVKRPPDYVSPTATGIDKINIVPDTEQTKPQEGAFPAYRRQRIKQRVTELKEPVPLRGVDGSKFKLEAIAWSDNANSRFAVINGRIIREGESIDGVALSYVGREHVTIQLGEEELELRLALH